MWTRSLLKSNAKQALMGSYWRSFLLCFLLSIVGVGASSGSTSVADYSALNRPEQPGWTGNNPSTTFSVAGLGLSVQQVSLVFTILLVMLALMVCWLVFLVNPLEVGRNRYFMENRQSLTPMSTVLTIFRPPYLNVVRVRFLIGLKVGLGSILIIPGIYWAFCYRQVPYLLAENPYLSATRAMELSREMMYGEKFRSYVLDLSFLGWKILCILSFGIGYLFLEPYMQATYAEFYAVLRSKAFAYRMTDSNELGGFVRHEV